MIKEFEITLSSGEIYVLAAFMNYDYVFGIEGTTFHQWGANVTKEAKSAVSLLETKGCIRCDLDGTIYIEPHIQNIIDCICDADIISTFSGSLLYEGKKASVYILNKDNRSAVVKANKTGEYEICLGRYFESRDILREIMVPDIQMHEKMLFEEATHIQQIIISFQQDEAKILLSKVVTNKDSARRLVKLLSGNCRYIDIQVHQKKVPLYNNVYSCMLVSDDDCIYKLQLDENDVLFIDSVDFSTVSENLNQAFRREINGE